MSFFKNSSLKIKLISLCVSLLAVSAVIGGISFYGLSAVSKNYESIINGPVPNLNYTNEMFLHFKEIQINLRSIGLQGISKEESDKYYKKVIEHIAEYEKVDKAYNEIPFVPGEEEKYNAVNTEWKKFKTLGQTVLDYYKSDSPENKIKMMGIFMVDCPEAAAKYESEFEKLKEFNAKNVDFFANNARSEAQKSNTLLIICITLGLLLGLTVGFMFANSIAKLITQVAKTLSDNANSITQSSSDIAMASQELSQATTEQAASLEETAASLEQLTSMVAKNTENAKNSSETSEQSLQMANQGKEAVERMMQSMEEINQSNENIMNEVNQSNQQMSEIINVIQEIGNKTKVINDIVFQTKLLSFNASVEAARAGEHGKGFAVVAEEVGNLAQMSGNAAKEISDMLEGSIKKVEIIVNDSKSKVGSLIQEGKQKVEVGLDVSRQCNDSLNEILNNVSQVSSMVSEISSASTEQSLGISEINKAVGQLDQVTQQNSASSEQSARAAEQLSGQAQLLKGAVIELLQVVNGEVSKQEHYIENNSNIFHLKKEQNKNKSIKFESNAKLKNESKSEMTAKKASGDLYIPKNSDSGFNH